VIEIQTLQSVEAAAEKQDRPALFACLAARPAAVRANAAGTILRFYAPGVRVRGGLARDFGSEPDAAVKPLFAELAGVIGAPASAAWKKFAGSLEMDMEKWRDGIGYDLEALAAMSEDERAMIKQWLRSRLTDGSRAIDWRELEAAAALDDTELLRSLARHESRDVRMRVKTLLGSDEEIEQELCRVFRETESLGEFARAEALAPHYPTENVKRAMIARLRKNDDFFVPLGMTLLEVYAQADGWEQRPFLFRVKEEGVQGPLMKELLAKVGK
jgi:hypothetical protein